jgi:hypothetical protein
MSRDEQPAWPTVHHLDKESTLSNNKLAATFHPEPVRAIDHTANVNRVPLIPGNVNQGQHISRRTFLQRIWKGLVGR